MKSHYFAPDIHPANLSAVRGNSPLSIAVGCDLASQPAKFTPIVMMMTFPSLVLVITLKWIVTDSYKPSRVFLQLC